MRLNTDEEQTKAWLGTAAILPAYQGQGYGSAGMRLLEETFSTVKKWDLCTILQEEPMVKFYEKCGYQQIFTKPEQEGMDMVYMTKECL